MYSVVEANLRAAMRCYGSVAEGEVRDYPGVTIASSGLDVPVFNSAMLTDATENIERMIATATAHYKSRGLGWTFWVCEELLPACQRDSVLQWIFQSKGMRRIAGPPGLYASRILPASKTAMQMHFSRVSTDSTRLEFAHMASTIFVLPFATSKRIYGGTEIWQHPSYGWIGYFEGKPVSIVTTVIAGGAIGVYSLGTLPQYQRCGFGETLLRHALAEAQRESGIHCSVLQATTQGLTLYQRMGYQVVSKFSIYMREGCRTF